MATSSRFGYSALLIGLPTALMAQAPIEYAVSFPNAVHHEAQIGVTWSGLDDVPLELRMSRSSPGRYAIHEFGKNVYALSFTDGQGSELEYQRSHPDQWIVSGHDGTVNVSYTLYADRIDGTYSAIDLNHAHLNMPATFMWAKGLEQRPLRIRFTPADASWKAISQLVATADPYVFTAPDFQYFMDSPVELSAFSLRSWEVESNGSIQTFRLAVHHEGEDSDVDVLFDKARKVVEEQRAIFGELPVFDHGSYTFIADYLSYAAGDGMEHRNSTIISSSQSLIDTDFKAQLGTLSHELFHAWNAERIRPVELEPFDFEGANMSSSLWFMEGFTSYYGPLAIHRAGEMTLGDYLTAIGNSINSVAHAPGRAFASPLGMSERAPFVDAAVANDPTNHPNMFLSYYTYGAALGLALDLTLRSRSTELSLDDYMRAMWQRHGRTGLPYTPADLQSVLAEASGDAAFAADFFARFIAGSELPDYASLLARAGLLLRPANAGKASAGSLTLQFVGERAHIANNTLIGSPLYEAGLERGDEIIALDRYLIRNQEQWDTALARYKPEDEAVIHYRQRGVVRQATLQLQEDSRLEVVTYDAAAMESGEAELRFREAWLTAHRTIVPMPGLQQDNAAEPLLQNPGGHVLSAQPPSSYP